MLKQVKLDDYEKELKVCRVICENENRVTRNINRKSSERAAENAERETETSNSSESDSEEQPPPKLVRNEPQSEAEAEAAIINSGIECENESSMS